MNAFSFVRKSWVDANWDVPGRRDLEKVYTALCRKGVQFPNSMDCQTLPLPQQASMVSASAEALAENIEFINFI